MYIRRNAPIKRRKHSLKRFFILLIQLLPKDNFILVNNFSHVIKSYNIIQIIHDIFIHIHEYIIFFVITIEHKKTIVPITTLIASDFPDKSSLSLT